MQHERRFRECACCALNVSILKKTQHAFGAIYSMFLLMWGVISASFPPCFLQFRDQNKEMHNGLISKPNAHTKMKQRSNGQGKHYLLIFQFIHLLLLLDAGGNFPVNQSSWHKTAWIIQLLWALMFAEQHEILNNRSAMALELPKHCPFSKRLVWLITVSPTKLIMLCWKGRIEIPYPSTVCEILKRKKGVSFLSSVDVTVI